nr:YhdP family protein [Luteibacter sp. Sphag1AF]
MRFFAIGLVASVLIGLALVMALGQLLLPLAARYPERVATLLSEQLHRPVTFASLEGSWSPSGPLFVMRDVTVAPAEGGDALHLPRAALKLDFGGLILPSRHLLNLRLSGLRLALHRAADGRWSVDGFGAGGDTQKVSFGNLSADLWLSNLQLDITAAPNTTAYELIADQLRISKQGNKIRLGAILRRNNVAGELRASGSFAEDGSDGRVYISGKDIDFAALTGDIVVNDYALTGGRGTFEGWLDWRDAHVVRAISRIDMDQFAIRGPARTVSVAGLHGIASFRRFASGQRVDWAGNDGGDLALSLSTEAERTHGVLVARALDLTPLLPWAGVLPQLSPSLAQWLGEGKPRGHLDDVRVEWDSEQGLHLAHAKFSGLGIDASGKLPGINHLDGEVTGDRQSLALHLPAQATTLDFTGVFRKPFVMSNLSGDVAAWQDDDGWHIGVDPLDFTGEGFNGQARGELTLLANDGGPFLDMYVALGRGDVPAAKLFWPMHSMSEGTVHWLDHALVSGIIERGDALVRGNLRDWPFHNNEGRFEGRAVIDDTVLDYGTGWPRAEGITAVASFVNNGMFVEATEGHSVGNAVTHATAAIPEFSNGVLDLQVAGTGTGSSFLDFAKQSPVASGSADTLNKMKLGGTGDFSFKLLLPLAEAKDFSLDGKASLRDADLVADEWKLKIDKITGPMTFDGKGLKAGPLKATYRGQPAQVDLLIAGANTDPNKIIGASLSGAFTVGELVSGYDNLAWLSDIAKGRGNFAVDFDIMRGVGNAPATQTLRVDSDLRGVELTMPAPVKKAPSVATSLSVQVGLPVDGARLDVALGDVVRGRLRLPDSKQPLAAAFNLGTSVPTLLPAKGYLVSGHASKLDVSGWVQYVVGSASTEGDSPGLAGLDVTADTGEVFAQNYSGMHITAKPFPQQLQLRVDSDGLAGSLSVPNDDMKRRGITARMDRLYWATTDDDATTKAKAKAAGAQATATAASVGKSDDKAAGAAVVAPNSMTGVNPSSLPPLHLQITDMRLGNAKLGEARLETWPTDEGMHIDQLRAQSKNVQITAGGDWTGTAERSQTHLKMDFASEDVARMLDALGFAGIFEGGRTEARLDATWPGSPSALALANMDGTLRVDVSNGRILEVQPGVGRLFGLVSVADLPRRLSLDFGDVLGKGFAFDAINGDFRFAHGDASTNNLVIKGPAAEITITGRTGLKARDYDQQVLVVPHVGNSLPVVGALAGGPVGAAAGLAVQSILGRGLNQAARKRYHVTGTWEKPVFTPIEKAEPATRQTDL